MTVKISSSFTTLSWLVMCNVGVKNNVSSLSANADWTEKNFLYTNISVHFSILLSKWHVVSPFLGNKIRNLES
jgi:hypothetical protein